MADARPARGTDKPQIDRRLYDVTISLLVNGEPRALSASASRAVIESFPTVRAEVARWRFKLGRPGRLLLIDQTLCREISAFLRADE